VNGEEQDLGQSGGHGSGDLNLLTPDDVCALLKVKKSWLYDVVEAGSLEAIRLGKQLRFRRSALERYLEGRAVGGEVLSPAKFTP
jgi:excisionase family DNA binding protein